MKAPGLDKAAAALALRTLANETRLQIVLLLLRGEASVSAIERELGLRQPNLSQQLGALRDAGLVVSRRESRSVVYSLAGPPQERLVTALSYGFGAPGAVPPPPSAASPATRARQAHLGAVFARVLVAE